MNNFSIKTLRYSLILILLVSGILSPGGQGSLQAQLTRGLIVEPAVMPGRAFLDPDGDGYVSQKTNGVQLGFTNPPNNDVTQSEIPYVAIIKPDPRSDLLRGPTGSFSEIVGVDEAGNNAILGYNDGTNWLFRFRIDGLSTNTITYCILIDIDGKFGFTGPNADHNAVAGNPGFEVEITLTTNFHVRVWNVDGKNGTSSNPSILAFPESTNVKNITNHHQKSIAITNSGGNPDYFYDFYIPFSELTKIDFFDSQGNTYKITQSTPMRMAAVTTMNTAPAIGNQALSDVGGTSGSGTADQIFTNFINTQTPTPPGEEVLERSNCPTLSSVRVGQATISGSTSEAVGTDITVSVYADASATTPISTATVKTTSPSHPSWSINVSEFTGLTLAEGQVVRATAKAPEKGTSIDNCNPQTVTSTCNVISTAPTSAQVVAPANSKGFNITVPLIGTIVRIYNSNYTLMDVSTLATGTKNPTDPTTSANQVVSFLYQSGNNWPAGVYYVTFQESGNCESSFYVACNYATGVSVVPQFTPGIVVTASSETVTGTGTAANAAIYVYANGVRIGSATTGTVSPFSFTATISGHKTCDVLTARQIVPPGCLSVASTSVTVTSPAAAPVIYPIDCAGDDVSSTTYTISGSLQEANNTMVQLWYSSNGTSLTTLINTVPVTNALWTVSGISSTTYPTGFRFIAVTQAGGCLSQSVNSNVATVTVRPKVSDYSISITNPVEGVTAISGSISGVGSPITIRAYVNEVLVGNPTLVSSTGSWTVSGLEPTDLYVGAQVRITVSVGSSCESALSSTFATVQCSPPPLPGYTGGNITYCFGGVGELLISGTRAGAVYQLVNSTFVAQGPAMVGTGGDITLTTNILTSNLTDLFVYTYNALNPSCGQISSTPIHFNSLSPTPSVTFGPRDLSVQSGTGTVNLSFTEKSTTTTSEFLPADKYTISWSFAATQKGFQPVSTPTAIPAAPGNIVIAVPTSPAPAVGTYSGTITITSDAGGCSRSYGFTVSVYGASSPPVITTHPVGATICTGYTHGMSVSASALGGMTYQWQVATSFLGTYSNIGTNSPSYTTEALAATRYYRVVVTANSQSTISNVAVVNVTSPPATPGAISGATSIRMGRSNYLLYSIAPVMGATSYTWEYVDGSGNALPGVSIIGSGTSVYVSYSSNAVSGNLRVRSEGVSNCGSSGWQTLAISITYNSCIISNKNVTPMIFR